MELIENCIWGGRLSFDFVDSHSRFSLTKKIINELDWKPLVVQWFKSYLLNIKK